MGSLLRSCAPKGYRGFESLLLRMTFAARDFLLLRNPYKARTWGFETERFCGKSQCESIVRETAAQDAPGVRRRGWKEQTGCLRMESRIPPAPNGFCSQSSFISCEGREATISGAVSEWFKEAVLKTVVPQGTGGSNPPCSETLFTNPIFFTCPRQTHEAHGRKILPQTTQTPRTCSQKTFGIFD